MRSSREAGAGGAGPVPPQTAADDGRGARGMGSVPPQIGNSDGHKENNEYVVY